MNKNNFFWVLICCATIYSADKKGYVRSTALKKEESFSLLLAKYRQEQYEKERALHALKRLALVLTMPDDVARIALLSDEIADPEEISSKATSFALCLLCSLDQADLAARLHKREIEKITEFLILNDKKPYCMSRSDYNQQIITHARKAAYQEIAAENPSIAFGPGENTLVHSESLKFQDIRAIFQRYVPSYMHHFPGAVSRGVVRKPQRVVRIAQDATDQVGVGSHRTTVLK